MIIVNVPSAPVVALNPPVSVDTVAPDMGAPAAVDTTLPVMTPNPGACVGVAVGVAVAVAVGKQALDCLIQLFFMRSD